MNEYAKSKLNQVKRGHKRATYDVEKINAILDAGFVGHVSYVFEGQSIVIPMAFGRKENKIYLHGSQANRMLLSIVEAESMSMTVMHLDALILARSGFHHSVNYRSATLFGSVRKIKGDREKEEALFCVMEQMMKGRWDDIRPMNQKELDRTLVLEMTIETASGKVRDVGVEDEPEDYDLDVWAGVVPIKQIAEAALPDRGKPQNMEIPDYLLAFNQEHKA